MEERKESKTDFRNPIVFQVRGTMEALAASKSSLLQVYGAQLAGRYACRVLARPGEAIRDRLANAALASSA